MALTKVPSNLDSITATTQSQGDGSTNVATTAYVDTGLNALIDSAPGNLNTLNELAAAMNDNASFFSTVLPLSGGTMTGVLKINDGNDSLPTLAPSTKAVFACDNTANFESSISIMGASNNGSAIINFGDYANEDAGQILYKNDNGGSDYMSFTTNTSEAMRIDSSGRVGIGTTSMGAPLHITNASPVIRLTDSDTSRFAQIVATDGNLRFDADNNNQQSDTNISFRTDNTERVRIDSSGNLLLNQSTSLIGINTSDGSDNKSVMLNGGGSASDSRGAYVWAKGNEFSSEGGFLRLHAGNVSGGAVVINTAGSERMRIDSNGHVGIGITPVPGASGMKTLHLHSAGNSAYLHLTNSDSGSAASDGFDLISGGAEGYVWNRENGNIRFGTNNAESARLTSWGGIQLGTAIGSSAYDGYLSIVANNGSSGIIETRNGNGLHHLIMKGDNNVAYGRIGLSTHTGSANMRLNPVNALEIDSDNNQYVRINGGTSGGGKFDALHLRHTNTTTTNDGPAIRWEGSYSSSGWQFGEMHAYNNGSGYGANIDLKVHPGTGTQNSSPVLSTRAGFKNGSFQTPGNHQFNFRANGASNPGNGATIVFDAVQVGNAAGCYNTSNGYYEAQVYGWYLFSIGIRYDSVSGSGYVRPQFAYLANGGGSWLYPHQGGWVDPIHGSGMGTGSYLSLSYTVPIVLSVGDTVRVVNNGNMSNTVNHDESHFGCIFMG